MLPIPPGEEVGPKFVRFLYFLAPAVIFTVAFNKWKTSEREKAVQKVMEEQRQLSRASLKKPSDVVHKTVE